MHFRLLFFAAAFAGLSLAALPSVAPAAPGGLAWNSVTRFVQNTDAAALQQPGNFDADYATASAIQPAESGGGGFMGKLKAAEAMARNMGDVMQKGFADQHYVAGTKERIDQVASKKATITDCTARTVTTLDLAKKTYRVVSMDQAASGGASSGGGKASARGNDDGSKISIDTKNAALGPKLVAGQSTSGFTSDTTFTETKPSGESHTSNAYIVGYYSSYAQPALSCSRSGGSAPSPGMLGQMSMLSAYMRLMDAMSVAGGDNGRFTLTQSGPSLPIGKLAMYDAMLLKGPGGPNPAFITERGNVRTIDANDPIFSVPSDFTKEE